MSKEHDKITTRLVIILQKLNSGERFSLDDLVEEFNVSKRTVQRDMHERLEFLPMIKEDGVYSLAAYCLGNLNYSDIRNFAALSSIQGLYPNLNDAFIVDILNEKVNSAYLVKGHEYEDVSKKSDVFKLINVAIVKKQKLEFHYNKKERVVNPYKLVNTEGIWYLVGEEEGVLKNFTLTKIVHLSQTENSFKPQKVFLETIQKNEAVWFSQNSIEVILEVDASVAEYFLRRKLLPYQTIIEKREDGLVLSAKVSYENEILKIVRYWIPHIKIVSPDYLNEKLKQELAEYMNIF